MKLLYRLILIVVLLAGAAVASLLLWSNQPLTLAADKLELNIEKNANQSVVQTIVAAGVQTTPALLQLWFTVSGDAQKIKAGVYDIERGTTPQSLLKKLVSGSQSLLSVTLVEGWNFAQVREAMGKAERLKSDSKLLSSAELMEKLGKPGVKPEGRFFPDTYTYARGSSDLAVWKMAMQAMDKNLEAAWAQRLPDSPLKNPDEALILASIIERETGSKLDRALVGSVFNNRLKINMPLQTDPTVLYGASMDSKGEYAGAYEGPWLPAKAQKNAWNTYQMTGLPRTPIAMPGKASLMAAVQPASSNALYFVAKGDGTGGSTFSVTLADHNRAVSQYIQNQAKNK